MKLSEFIEHLQSIEEQDWPVYIFFSDSWDEGWARADEKSAYINKSMERIEIA